MLWTIGRLLFYKRPGIIPAIIGLGLALSALAWKTTPTDNGYNTICERHLGFYVWIACAVLLAFVALAEFTMHPKLKSQGGAS
jgi:tellurite resistance protein TehA-like permease